MVPNEVSWLRILGKQKRILNIMIPVALYFTLSILATVLVMCKLHGNRIEKDHERI